MQTLRNSVLAALAALTLTGCGASYQTAINGYESAAIKDIQAAEDNHIMMWTAVGCATPLSAIARHPNIVPALQALCLPAGANANPALLLEDMKK